jgi:hypothetical protein
MKNLVSWINSLNQKTPQQELDRLNWEESPPAHLKRLLILNKIQPRKRMSASGMSVHRTDVLFFHSVSRYRISYMFSNSDPANGTSIGDGMFMKPDSESCRLGAELANLNFRKRIKEEFDIDLHELAADKNFG